jgi:hypothetical protein
VGRLSVVTLSRKVSTSQSRKVGGASFVARVSATMKSTSRQVDEKRALTTFETLRL